MSFLALFNDAPKLEFAHDEIRGLPNLCPQKISPNTDTLPAETQ